MARAERQNGTPAVIAPVRSSVARRQVRSIADQVADAVREMILMGELLGGEMLSQETVADSLNVSTMPVREACQRLSHEGFLEASRGRSFRVVITTREDISDIYWLHSLIAGELTARAATKATPEDIATLRQVHQQWTKAARSGATDLLEQHNFAFHRVINRAADAPKLVRAMTNNLKFIPNHFYALVPKWISKSTQSHAEILQCIAAADADTARHAAAQHVLQSGQELLRYFDDRGYWLTP